MKLFKKKRVLKSVAKGRLIPLEQVNDNVFSTNMMGSGFAIVEHSGKISSPIAGKVLTIFPTLHAITIQSDKGDTILIHMGLDTVELKGAPFLLKVSENEMIKSGTLLAEMNLSSIKESGKDPVVIVVLPEVKEGKVLSKNTQVTVEDDVFQF